MLVAANDRCSPVLRLPPSPSQNLEMRAARYRMARASGLICAAMLGASSALGLSEVMPAIRALPVSPRTTIAIFAVQFASNVTGGIVGCLGLLLALSDVTRGTVLAALLLSIASCFGAVMSLATVLFTARWTKHAEALNAVLLLFLGLVSFIDAFVLAVVTACLLRRPLPDSPLHARSSVRKALPVLASLTLLSGLTAILGFGLGLAVHPRRPSLQFAGGVHSGACALLCGLLAIAGLSSRCSRHDRALVAAVVVTLLALIASVTSLFTERLELAQNLAEKPVDRAARVTQNIVLAKCSLVLFSNLLNLLLGSPLLICLATVLHRHMASLRRLEDEAAAVYPGDLLMSSSLTSAGLPDGTGIGIPPRNELSKVGHLPFGDY